MAAGYADHEIGRLTKYSRSSIGKIIETLFDKYDAVNRCNLVFKLRKRVDFNLIPSDWPKQSIINRKDRGHSDRKLSLHLADDNRE